MRIRLVAIVASGSGNLSDVEIFKKATADPDLKDLRGIPKPEEPIFEMKRSIMGKTDGFWMDGIAGILLQVVNARNSIDDYNEKIRFIRKNLNHCKVLQDLLGQTESETEMIIIGNVMMATGHTMY